MIKHSSRTLNGWRLIEFARQLPSGANPHVIEKFVYERRGMDGETERAVGYRTEGEQIIKFKHKHH